MIVAATSESTNCQPHPVVGAKYCASQGKASCPPVLQSRLAPHWALNALGEAWRRLGRGAKGDGCELLVMSISDPLGDRGEMATAQEPQDTSPAAQTLGLAAWNNRGRSSCRTG